MEIKPSRESRLDLEKRKSRVDAVQDMKQACDTFLRDQRNKGAVRAFLRALEEARVRVEAAQ